jgi:acetylornithine deacetylase/succinyl-diaminopimelate desuccinylase-like protein
VTSARAERAIDWEAVTKEAVALLVEYVRIDTTNPPGNESLACDWLAALLDAEGITSRRIDPGAEAGAPRASLIATLTGDGSRGGPLLLLHHSDVVPVERAHWTEEPFAGAVRDGHVWGRGTIDMKGMAVMELLVMLLHRRLSLPLGRDLTLLAVADEEAGGHWGVEFLDRAYPELLSCDYVINEGGMGSQETFGVERPIFTIGVSEKGPLWLTLRTTGRPGHGSVPNREAALERLVRALARIEAWQRPPRLVPEVRAHLEALHEAGALAAPPTAETLAALAEQQPRLRSLQSTSIAITGVTAGVKHNVIPAQAEATLDVRLLPGDDPARFLDELAGVIDDPAIEVETVFGSSSAASPLDTDLYRAMEQAARQVVEGAAVVPGVSTGFTDSRVFRSRGIPAYGFVPVLLSHEESGRAHGNDERISIENLRIGVEILFRAVRAVCEPA